MSIKPFDAVGTPTLPLSKDTRLGDPVGEKAVLGDKLPTNRFAASELIDSHPTRSSEAEIWSSTIKAVSLEMDGLSGALGRASERSSSDGVGVDQIQGINRRATKLIESIESKLSGLTPQSRLLIRPEAKRCFTTSLKNLSEGVSRYLTRLSQSRLQLLASPGPNALGPTTVELDCGFDSGALVLKALKSASEGVLSGSSR